MSAEFNIGDVFYDEDRRILNGKLPARTLEVVSILIDEKGKRSARVYCRETGRISTIRGARLLNSRYYKRITRG